MRWSTCFAAAMSLGLAISFIAQAHAQDCQWPTWNVVSTDAEMARYEHALAYDAARGQVVLYGGRVNTTTLLEDTHLWDGSRWVSGNIQGPGPRAGHAMAYDPVRGRVVLHGGVNGSPLTDTWEWDGQRWLRVSENGPVSMGHVMAYDPVGERLLLANHLGELWQRRKAVWTLLDNSGPKNPASSVAFDEARGCLVVCGGQGTAPVLGYTAEWTPQHGWKGFGRNGFPFNGLFRHVAFYNPVKQGVMMFAGTDGTGFYFQGVPISVRAGTFAWDGSRWATWGQLGIFGPSEWERIDHAVAPMPGGRALVFGGRTSAGLRSDTLLLEFVPASPEPLLVLFGGVQSIGTFDPGQTVHVRANVSDAASWWFMVEDRGSRYEWQHNGVILQDGPGVGGDVVGSTMSVLQVFNARLAASGFYQASVTTCSGQIEVGSTGVTIRCQANLTTTANPSLPGYGIPDARLTSDDFFYYIQKYAEGSIWIADLTTTGATVPGMPGWLVPDGVLTSDDFFAYLALYVAGC